MTPYQQLSLLQLQAWQLKMEKSPSYFGRISKKVQTKVNGIIPEKIHRGITVAIREMTRTVLLGAGITIPDLIHVDSLEELEAMVQKSIKRYRNTATAEGAITGAGGILLGLADFPLWLVIKMKMLFEIATLYGYNVRDLKERIFILHIFQLTFSSQEHRNKIFDLIRNWKQERENLPADFNDFDWRTFQQEYRDYLDIAKLLQLVPGVGAAVGAYVNHKLTSKLGDMAMNAYRLRLAQDRSKLLTA